MANAQPPEDGQRRWHLLGAGALGGLFAAYLQRAGAALELIVRDEDSLQQLRAHGGITLIEPTLSDATKLTTIAVAAATPNSVGAPITHLLVCTKAQQTRAAIGALKSKIAPDILIVLLQNGMGVRELLQHELPHATILHALSTEGAYRRAPFQITHAGRGNTVIGAIEPRHHALAENAVRALQCELPIAFAPDIERRLWLKLAVNSVINPLTALHRCRNGELLDLDNIETIVTRLSEELSHIARAEGIALSAAQMREEIYRVMRATAANKSSMLQDIEAGRATEIDFINGFIVQRAHRHGIACAQHARLLAAIRALERGSPLP